MIVDPYNYFTREMDSNLSKSGPHISDLITKSTAWLESWNMEYLRSRGIKIPQSEKRKAYKRSIKSQPELKIPYCDPVDIVKHFIKTEREKELARYYNYYTSNGFMCAYIHVLAYMYMYILAYMYMYMGILL